MWEDSSNVKGGRWIVRCKKLFTDLYWEDLLMALVGGRTFQPTDVCGVVVSVRDFDSISVWTPDAQDKAQLDRVKDALVKVLRLPAHVNPEYRPHDQSLTSSVARLQQQPSAPSQKKISNQQQQQDDDENNNNNNNIENGDEGEALEENE